MAANRKPAVGHVVYDSGADTISGKKRAVLPGGGGASVADRARLFGAQVQSSAPGRASISANQPTRRPAANAQPNRQTFGRQENTYQSLRDDPDRRPNQGASYAYASRPPVAHRSATNINERPRREPGPSAAETYNYSRTARSYNPSSRSPPRRRPGDSYDSFQHVNSQRHDSSRAKPPQRKPSDSYTSEEEDTYGVLYDKPPSSKYTIYQPSKQSNYQPPKQSNYQPSNYFRPIQDPLDVLFKDTPHEYIQHEVVMAPPPADNSHLQPFDLGSLINRIQQDYADHARPYVSSVQFVQHNQSLANVGFITPATSRKDYSRRPTTIYNRPVPASSNQYDIIDSNGFNPYEKMNSRSHYDHNAYSSIRRRRQHRHYHNTGTSPIHVLETSSKTNAQPKSETPPPPKAPTPVEASSSEDDETSATNTQATATKTEETKTSSNSEEEDDDDEEEEEEDDEEEEESAAAPPPLPAPIPAINGAARASATLPGGVARSSAPNQTPASESDETESEESESDSDSDTDGGKKKKKKKKSSAPAPPASAARPAPPRAVPPTTPGATARPAPGRTVPLTPQAYPRVTPLRGKNEEAGYDDPPETSHSVNSFDMQDGGKLTFGGKLKSFRNKFRRNKS